MSIENNQPNPAGSGNPVAVPEAPPVAGGQPAPVAPPVSAAPGSSKEPKLITIPTRAMAKLKADERERGRKAALAEAQAEKDSQARKLGFRNWDDMVARGGQQRGSSGKGNKRPNQQQQPRQGQGQQQKPAAQSGGDPNAVRALTRLQRENQKLVEDRRRANRQRAVEEKRRSEAERRLVEREAESELREAAVRAGVKDVDYAIYMLRRQLAGRTEKELESFNESDFFAKSLRESHPYLYGIEERPATTTVVDTRVAPPRPATPPAAPPGEERDARRMSQEQFHADLRRRGLTIPSLGLPGGR